MSHVYVLKVERRPVDGWGRDTPNRIDTLGTFSTMAKAEQAEADYTERTDGENMFDIGDPWIEQYVVN